MHANLNNLQSPNKAPPCILKYLFYVQVTCPSTLLTCFSSSTQLLSRKDRYQIRRSRGLNIYGSNENKIVTSKLFLWKIL